MEGVENAHQNFAKQKWWNYFEYASIKISFLNNVNLRIEIGTTESPMENLMQNSINKTS
jgi:hypothetical protein